VAGSPPFKELNLRKQVTFRSVNRPGPFSFFDYILLIVFFVGQ